MEVENSVVRNEAVVQDATKRVDNVEIRQTRLEQELERERERARKKRADEMRERDIRRKNVVMHRVGEADETVRAIEDRRAWDLKSCDNIFKALKLPLTSEKSVRFCTRVGEKGDGPRPLAVSFRREEQKEDLLENARKLRNTQFAEVTIIPDLTQEQRKDEAGMQKEAEERNKNLSAEDRAKYLEWIVVGARGERRMIKGMKRPASSARRPQQAASQSSRSPALLPGLPQAGPWGPRVGGRGGASAVRGTGTKRKKGTQRQPEVDRDEQEDEEVEEEEMEDIRQPPLPQPGKN
jgi:hypothetical protein